MRLPRLVQVQGPTATARKRKADLVGPGTSVSSMLVVIRGRIPCDVGPAERGRTAVPIIRMYGGFALIRLSRNGDQK